MSTPPPYRDLSVRSYPDFDRGIPAKPTDWSTAELADWKAHVLAQPGVDAVRFERRWASMLEHRAETLERDVPYYARPLPPAEVVQELPLVSLASRVYLRAPQVPLLSHRLSEVLDVMVAMPGKPTKASAQRVAQVVGAFHPNRRTRYGNAARMQSGSARVLLGGLQVQVVDTDIRVSFAGTLLCRAPALDAQLPNLRRVASLWARLTRRMVESCLRLGVPASPSLTTALELVLPRMDAAGVYANALILRGHCVESARRTVLEDSNGYADQPARHAIAGAMLRHGDGRPEFEVSLQRHLEWVFDGLPVQRLRPATLSMADVLARVDVDTVPFITAYRDGREVGLSQPADAYDVRVDSITGPRVFARVHSLTLAVDLERSNRVQPSMRLQMRLAA